MNKISIWNILINAFSSKSERWTWLHLSLLPLLVKVTSINIKNPPWEINSVGPSWSQAGNKLSIATEWSTMKQCRNKSRLRIFQCKISNCLRTSSNLHQWWKSLLWWPLLYQQAWRCTIFWMRRRIRSLITREHSIRIFWHTSIEYSIYTETRMTRPIKIIRLTW